MEETASAPGCAARRRSKSSVLVGRNLRAFADRIKEPVILPRPRSSVFVFVECRPRLWRPPGVAGWRLGRVNGRASSRRTFRAAPPSQPLLCFLGGAGTPPPCWRAVLQGRVSQETGQPRSGSAPENGVWGIQGRRGTRRAGGTGLRNVWSELHSSWPWYCWT